MTVNPVDISSLTDADLVLRTERLAAGERVSTTDLVEHLAEFDLRRLWAGEHYLSMHEYCVYRLRLSDGAAFKRIRAARAVRRFPILLEMLREGRLTLASICLLHPYLEEPDAAALIIRARGLRVRELEAMLSARQSGESKRDVIRFVGTRPDAVAPSPEAAGLPLFAAPISAATIVEAPPAPEPLPAATPRLVRFAFTADEDFYRLLERVRSLMRHKYPDGRLDGILGEALKALLARKDPMIRWRLREGRR